MNERYYRQWHDPTANRAVYLADRDRPDRQKPISPQAAIDNGIHNLRQLLAEGVISNAYYRAKIDPLRALRASLKQTQKGGGLK